eukprot:TRINITY_DN175_c0_g1_i1.p1 TRINITY_DN175_c0_g1~~TRINITY_DN175_c0_g1_i1.p1  ORF type:complete len:838 (+),score=142.13 TRINITY_DN175_c0_g1_i1:2-2515(+)
MGIFRSEKMGLYTITIPKDSCWEVMEELGKMDSLHFIDLNANEQVFSRTFSNFIKRADEAERRIRYIETECERFKIKLKQPESPDVFMKAIDEMTKTRKKAASTFFDEIENELQDKENFLLEQTKKYHEMHDHYNYLIEYKFVLSKTMEILTRDTFGRYTGTNEEEKLIAFNYIAGVINSEDQIRFKRMIFRATRGNAVTVFEDMGNPIEDFEGNQILKTIYVIVFKEGETIRQKVIRICDSFSSERFDVPKNEIHQKQEEVERKLTDTQNLMQITKDEIKNALLSIAGVTPEINASRLELQKWFVVKEKSLYNTLNYLRPENMLFRGVCWCPLNMEQPVYSRLQQLATEKNIVGPQFNKIKDHDLNPPTYFRKSEFVDAFQGIVDTYGTPKYREANPGLFTIVTFPFLFGVMFGDACHGLILLGIGVVLCWKKDEIEKGQGILAGLLGARWLLLLMGFFATFNGFIYNDFAAVPMNFGNSCYYWEDNTTIALIRRPNCIYAFGMDPVWNMSSNSLAFLNSFKMKLAVILGVSQMALGVFMKCLNSIEFGKWEDFVFEFVPQMLFLLGYFGYMDAMIFVKWLKNWEDVDQEAPTIITILVNIPLKFGSVTQKHALYNKSIMEPFGAAMFILIICMIPLMLLIKPYILKSRFNQQVASMGGAKEVATLESLKGDEGDQELQKRRLSLLLPKDPEFHMSEIFIHQIIETIEFVLGTISNTASYLRLWALSLAHAELSEVFFSYSMKMALNMDTPNPGVIFALYFVLAGITFGVLLCMDPLECFLHALRLHWVEFQNKFYKGDGYPFEPYSYKTLLKSVNPSSQTSLTINCSQQNLLFQL